MKGIVTVAAYIGNEVRLTYQDEPGVWAAQKQCEIILTD